MHSVRHTMVCVHSVCRDWLKDVLSRGVAFAASAVHRQFCIGCVDHEMTAKYLYMLVEIRQHSLKDENAVHYEKFGADGRYCQMPVTLGANIDGQQVRP